MNLIFDLWIYSRDKVHETKMLCKENFKVIIFIGLIILYQNIVSKMFLVDTLLNIGYLLEPQRLVYILFFVLWKEAIIS
jgi:hypothetical protein